MSTPIHPQRYDSNFCFPVPEALESERVLLTPFIPSEHAEPFISQALHSPEIFTYLAFGPFKNAQDLVSNLIEARVQNDPGYILFAIYDKTKLQTVSDSEEKPADLYQSRGALAGAIGLINSSKVDLVTEIGCVMILPAFQRTYVASNAVGLLLNYALNLPSFSSSVYTLSTPTKSLGLRRVCWKANTLNRASVRLAERMGFRMEGLLRWDRVYPAWKKIGNEKDVRENDPRAGCLGQDTALLALCWDDWEGGARDIVDGIMVRVI